MPDDRFTLLDEYARKLDQDADLVVLTRNPDQVRRIAVDRTRRRRVTLLVGLLVAVLSFGLVANLSPRSRMATPQWGGPSATSPAETLAPSATSSSDPSSTPPSAPSTLSSAPVTSSAPSAVVTPEPWISLKSVADIEAQSWMPTGAKALLVAQFRSSFYARCADHGMTIKHYRMPDLIEGGEGGQECGGMAYLWGLVAGQWKVLAEDQQPPRCTTIRDSGWNAPIPKSMFGGICFTPNGSEMPYTPTTPTPVPTHTASLQQPQTTPS